MQSHSAEADAERLYTDASDGIRAFSRSCSEEMAPGSPTNSNSPSTAAPQDAISPLMPAPWSQVERGFEFNGGNGSFDESSSDVMRFVRMMQDAAKLGNAKAQFSLGLLHLQGIGEAGSRGKGSAATVSAAWAAAGLEHSIPHAFKLFQEAAEQGHKEALCNLGNMYDQGLGVEQSDNAAKHYWLQAATTFKDRKHLQKSNSNGNFKFVSAKPVPQAQFNLGLYAETGRGYDDEDDDSATDEEGDGGNEVGRSADNGGGESGLRGWLVGAWSGTGVVQGEASPPTVSAGSSSSSSTFKKAKKTKKKRDTVQTPPRRKDKCDPAAAMRWYHLAALQGHAKALNNLGALYEVGVRPRQTISLPDVRSSTSNKAKEGPSAAATAGGGDSGGGGLQQGHEDEPQQRQREASDQVLIEGGEMINGGDKGSERSSGGGLGRRGAAPGGGADTRANTLFVGGVRANTTQAARLYRLAASKGRRESDPQAAGVAAYNLACLLNEGRILPSPSPSLPPSRSSSAASVTVAESAESTVEDHTEGPQRSTIASFLLPWRWHSGGNEESGEVNGGGEGKKQAGEDEEEKAEVWLQRAAECGFPVRRSLARRWVLRHSFTLSLVAALALEQCAVWLALGLWVAVAVTVVPLVVGASIAVVVARSRRKKIM